MRAKKLYRADKRNLLFGRKPVGNTNPFDRRVIWTLVKKYGPTLAASVYHLPFVSHFPTFTVTVGNLTLTNEEIENCVGGRS